MSISYYYARVSRRLPHETIGSTRFSPRFGARSELEAWIFLTRPSLDPATDILESFHYADGKDVSLEPEAPADRDRLRAFYAATADALRETDPVKRAVFTREAQLIADGDPFAKAVRIAKLRRTP